MAVHVRASRNGKPSLPVQKMNERVAREWLDNLESDWRESKPCPFGGASLYAQQIERTERSLRVVDNFGGVLTVSY